MKKDNLFENEGFEVSSLAKRPLEKLLGKVSTIPKYSDAKIIKKLEIDCNNGLFNKYNYSYMTFLLETIVSDNILVEFKKVNYSKDELYKINHDFFKDLNTKYSDILVKLNKRIIKPYIISKSNNMVDACDYSRLTKIPNVYVRNDSTILTPIKLVHETQHQINYMINEFSDKTHLKEAPSIFSEMLLAEQLYSKTNDKEYLKAYLFRAGEIFKNIRLLKNYLNFLIHYKTNKIDNYQEVLSNYDLDGEDVMDINTLKIIYYILSFLTAHSLFDKYSDNKQEGIAYLDSIIDGTIMNNDVNFNEGYEKGMISFEKRYTKIIKMF